MKKLIIKGDLIVGEGNGISNGVPYDLSEDIDIKTLRYDGNDIVNGKDYSEFFIDDLGDKHIIQHDARWQPLSCQYDDVLINNDADTWRVKTAVDELAILKTTKLTEINTKSTEALSAITSLYTREEIDTWPVQEAEANAWTADNTATTPLLDAMVANRPGIDKPTLVSRILTNSGNYKAFSGAVIGKKQGYEDAVAALTADKTQAELDALTQTDIDVIVVTF